MKTLHNLEFKDYKMGLKGEPSQRIAVVHSSSSGHIKQGVWDCGPGEFEIDFAWDECVLALEGRVELTDLKTGHKFTLESGSMFYFAAGSRWLWCVPWKFKKLFTVVSSGLR